MQNNSIGSNNIAIGVNSGSIAGWLNITNQNNQIVIGNNVSATASINIAWTTISDIRNKNVIGPVPLGLDFVKQINPIAFTMKTSREDDTPNGEVHYGFSAQELLAIEGDEPVIINKEDPNCLRYKDSDMTAVLVNAIKELTTRLEALEGAK